VLYVISCTYDLGVSNKPIHQSNPRLQVTNISDNNNDNSSTSMFLWLNKINNQKTRTQQEENSEGKDNELRSQTNIF
jgi:hypothetical protein